MRLKVKLDCCCCCQLLDHSYRKACHYCISVPATTARLGFHSYTPCPR